MAERHSRGSQSIPAARSPSAYDGREGLLWHPARNGLPEPDSTWQPGAAQRADDQRDTEIRSKVTRARRLARQRARRGNTLAAPEPATGFDQRDHDEAEQFAGGHYPRPGGERCEDCGYRLGSPGHQTECGDTP